MSVTFKYAVVEINDKPVFVTKKEFDEAKQALQDGLRKVEGITDHLEKMKENGMALETPEGMKPVNLGSAVDFTKWVANKLGDMNFNLQTSIAELPPPLNSGLSAVTETDFVLYSAALFYTGTEAPEPIKSIYGELVIGFKIPDDVMKDFDFPLSLQEIVIAVDNYT